MQMMVNGWRKFEWGPGFWRFAGHCLLSPVFLAKIRPNYWRPLKLLLQTLRVAFFYFYIGTGLFLYYVSTSLIVQGDWLVGAIIFAPALTHTAVTILRLQTYYLINKEIANYE